MGYGSAVNYLYGLQKHGVKLGLDNTVKLLFSLGNPQNSFRSIHIAGTNGKGSTSAMIAAILRAAGFKVGLFTSPHLVSFTERITVNNEEITEEETVKLTEEIRSRIEGSDLNPTFFEVVTAMGFLYFKRKNIEWAVVETGMGGRLDATNVLVPEASVITNINYDHKDFLGDSLIKIAGEKAGIIKDGIPVVTSLQKPSVMDLIKKKADEKGAQLFIYGKDFSALIKKGYISGSVFDYYGADNFENLFVPLPGRHQVSNAALALKMMEVLSQKPLPAVSRLNPDGIRRGLENTKWQGRLEFISKEPPILLDGAHNPSAAAILADTLKEIFLKTYQRVILVIGVMSDKDIAGIMKPLLPVAAEIILTTPAYERAASPQKLAKVAAEMGFMNTHIAPTVREAIDMAISLYEMDAQRHENSEKNFTYSPIHRSTDSLILITGSFYTIGEAKEIVCGKGVLSELRETL